MIHQEDTEYGNGDTSYQAAGGETGIRALVDAFYTIMGNDTRFTPIFNMHPEDIDVSRDKLATFLSGWLGGPRIYPQKYGSIGIPAVHQHLPITNDERDQWLSCMKEAIDNQPFDERFKHYLLEQLAIPAQAIVNRCAASKDVG